jgi:hypothetical protein
MNDFMKVLGKYFILLIVLSLFGMPWFYAKIVLLKTELTQYWKFIESIPTYVGYLIRIIIIILLIVDFQKKELKYVALACIASLFYPLLGVVILALLLLENKKENASA